MLKMPDFKIGRPRLALAIFSIIGVAYLIRPGSETVVPKSDPAPSTVPTTQYQPERIEHIATYRRNAKDAVKASLKDPDSAQFSSMTIFKNAGGITVCGLVNAKNGFGGYSGRTPFIVSPMAVFLGDDVTATMIDEACKGDLSEALAD